MIIIMMTTLDFSLNVLTESKNQKSVAISHILAAWERCVLEIREYGPLCHVMF